MRFSVLAAVAAVSILAPLTLRAECRFEADRNAGSDVDGITKVVITAGAGDLKVLGLAGAKRIEGTGKACASSEDLLKQINLQVRREGSVLYVEAILPKLEEVKLFGSVYASLGMKVTLPNNLPVEAQDSSGEAELRDLKSLKMVDSSGELEIENIAELLDLQDSSGEIEIERVGSLRLQDSSGDVRVSKVRGEVDVLSDSSGDIAIDDVGSHVHIQQDSSGDILITQVKGNVLVDADTSGGITARNVSGDFTVRSDTGGGIKFDDVRGRVTTP